MGKLIKTGLWLNRIVLSFVSILFATIGLKNIIHPLERSAEAGIILHSATALSVARVSMGAFPLGFAIVIFISIFSNPKLYQGILSVFILVTITTIVRITSLRIDGHSDFGLKVLVPEILLTILSAAGLFLELQRRKFNSNIKTGQ